MHRGVRLTVVLVGAATLAGGGWLAGRQIKSPDAAARAAAAPPASNITVPVEERLLSTNVVTRGSVHYDEGTNVRVAKGAAAAGIVTRGSAEVGSTMNEGALVVEVDSRPAFVFAGELPAYRDITPGTQGDDVRQLQAALTRLGVFTGTADGTFGPSTQDAIGAYWRKMGYEPRPPSKAERDAVTEAQRRVDAAKEALRQATVNADKAAAGPKPSERLQLDAAVSRAREDLAKTKAGRAAAIDETNAAVDDAALANASAAAGLTGANAALATARAGTNPDTSAPISSGELAGFERAATDAELAARRAQRALDDARAKAAAAPDQQDALVAAGQDAVDLAVQARTEALAAGDTAALQSAVADATRSLTDAQQSLSDAAAAAGVVVPESEIVFLKDLPRRIDQSSAVRGQPVPDQVVSVSGTDLVIDTTVSAADRKFVRKDTKVKLDEQSLGIAFDGTVTSIADQPGSGAADASKASAAPSDRYAVRITPDVLPKTVKVADLRGVSLRITIPVQSTKGKVTAVPIAAVSAGGDGTSRVDVEDTPGAAPRTVKVRTGLSAQGFVEVSAIEGTLKAGDRVVVGKKQASGASTTVAGGSSSDGSSNAGNTSASTSGA